MSKTSSTASPLWVLRETLGYSRPEFAKRIGTSESNLEKIETGRSSPLKELTKRILLEYGIDVGRIENMVGMPRAVIPSKKTAWKDAITQWQWGSGFFSIIDFGDLDGLVEELRARAKPLAPFLWDRLSAGARRALRARSANKELLKRVLVQEFNRLIRGSSIYDQTRFADVTLSPKTAELQDKNAKGERLVAFNRALLEDAYLRYIRRHWDGGLFLVDDFRDLDGLVEELCARSKPLGQFLWGRFSAGARRALKARSALQQVLIKEFNRLIRDNSIYEQTRIAGVTISPKTGKLRTQNPKGERLAVLNRALLEDAYPQYIRRQKSYREMLEEEASYVFERLVVPKLRVAFTAANRESKSIAFVNLVDQSLEKIVKHLGLEAKINTELRNRRYDEERLKELAQELPNKLSIDDELAFTKAHQEAHQAGLALRKVEEERIEKIVKSLKVSREVAADLVRGRSAEGQIDWHSAFDFEREANRTFILMGGSRIILRIGRKKTPAAKQRQRSTPLHRNSSARRRPGGAKRRSA